MLRGALSAALKHGNAYQPGQQGVGVSQPGARFCHSIGNPGAATTAAQKIIDPSKNCRGAFIPWLKQQLQEKNATVVVIEASAANTQLLTSLLSADEQARAQRYTQASDRQLSRVAHGLKRLVISRLLDIPPGELQFGTTGKGKPVCLQEQAPAFNLSHAQPWAAIVFSPGFQVGVDIEFPRAMDYGALAESTLTAIELHQFNQINHNPRFFLERWSQKEAISKACGLGLYLDFKTINTQGTDKVTIDDINYYFYSQLFLDGFISVATTVAQRSLQVISFADIKHELMSAA